MGLIPQTSENILKWASFISSIRAFLKNREFIEVFTPHLVEEGAFESSIDPLKVTWRGGKAELHTSPEIQMKAVLSKVSHPIYQICRCFRDDLESGHHSREFTMLELYEKDKNYTDTIALVQALLVELCPSKLEFQRYSVEEVFKKEAGISLADLSDAAVFRKAVTQSGLVETLTSDSWEDIFFRIMIEKIEPSLKADNPIFLYDYPLAVSPLSQQRPGSPFAERFELYWKGMELCNGCTELSDADELRRRHQQESEKRKAEGKPPHPFSETLFAGTSSIGRAAGVAIGLERLFLALNGVD